MASREAVRDALTILLQTALVGSGKPLAEFVGYKKTTVDKSPLGMLMSAGSQRGFDAVGSVQTIFQFAIVVFVPDADAAASWSENDVEDTLDDIDTIIEATIQANRKTANWENLDWSSEPSIVEDITISGAVYATETHMLAVTILE